MSKYLKYTIQNTTPVRIADDETSQHGQTDTLRYFPGSTIRGYVVTQLSKNTDFENVKRTLFSGDICFLNAYPCIKGHETIPSLKGFYEDKKEIEGKKLLNNVIREDVKPGFKRASMGRFCYLEEDCICYSDVGVGEDVNINTGREADKKNMFRSRYIQKNQTFSGYILFQDGVSDELIRQIAGTLEGTMYLGNRRSAGYGACVCTQKEIEQGLPYKNLRVAKGGEYLYMVLLSNTVMRDQFGELTGLCLEDLAERLGCDSLSIERCATSTIEVHGYNRMWQGAVPSAVMYEAGSVFKLHASAPVSEEKLRELEASGIGIRRDEGFGQIVFLQDFTQLRCKLAVSFSEKQNRSIPSFGKRKDNENDLKIAATGLVMRRLEEAMDRYIITQKESQNPTYDLSQISSSKKGLVLSMCQQLCYQPVDAKIQILEFVKHEDEKNSKRKNHDGKRRPDVLCRYLTDILEGDLFQLVGVEWKNQCVMGIPLGEVLSKDRMIQYKLDLMIRQLRFDNRGGKA